MSAAASRAPGGAATGRTGLRRARPAGGALPRYRVIRRALGLRRSWRRRCAVRAAGGGRAGHRQRGHRLHPRERRLPSDHHLPRLCGCVVGAAALRCAGCSGRHVPRPPPACAAAHVLATARGQLRGGQGQLDHHPVRLLLPAAGGAFVGNMLVSDSASTAHGHLDVCGTCRHRSPVGRVHAVVGCSGVTHRPADRGRGIGDRALPRASIASAVIVDNGPDRGRAGSPGHSSTCCGCRSTFATWCSSAMSTHVARRRGR